MEEKLEGFADNESSLKPIMASVVPLIIQFIMGAEIGQSSTMIPQLLSPTSRIKTDEDTATWIASIGVLATPFSSLVCGPLTDLFGRKKILQVYLCLSAIGFTIVGISSTLTEILVGRLWIGLAAGFGFSSLLYVSEITIPRHRNFLLPASVASSSLGLLYIYTVGALLCWYGAALVTAGVSVAAIVYSFFIPESPAWLFFNDRMDETISSLKWLKGRNCDMDAEIKQLQIASRNRSAKISSILTKLNSITVVKPFFILLCMAVLQNGTGLYILMYYSISFLNSFHADFDPILVSIGVALARFISCTIVSFLMRECDRKALGATSGFSMAAILLIMLVFPKAFWDGKSLLFFNYSSISAVCIISYMLACSFGVLTLPWTMVNELYPLNVRGLMCGVSNAINYIFIFITLKMYNVFMSNLQVLGSILLFFVFSILFGLFSICILPETRGKTLVEIERGFEREKSKETAGRK